MQLPPGTVLVRRAFGAPGDREHDHCEFCWATFMDSTHSEAHRRPATDHPETLTEGWTTTDDHPHGAGYHWVCPRCVEDFAEEYGWSVR